jgi:release factor glutamine methyltransferase
MDQDILFNTLLAELKQKIFILPDKMEETPENTLVALWNTSAGNQISPIAAENAELPKLTPQQLDILNNLIQDRISGVPLAYLTERQHFMGMELIVKKGLYIPRKETELLAKTAISILNQQFSDLESYNVIDVCSGIGTVALAISNCYKKAQVFGSDIYEPAIECAKVNAEFLGIENRVSFYTGDLFEPLEDFYLRNKTQLIVSAPPYISTVKVKQMANEISDYEPREAFDAGPWGFSIFFKLISLAPEFLQSKGYLVFECGLGQGEFLVNRIKLNKQYQNVTEVYDENNNVRVIIAQKINS